MFHSRESRPSRTQKTQNATRRASSPSHKKSISTESKTSTQATMVYGVIRSFQAALKYRGGWGGLLEHMYTVRIHRPQIRMNVDINFLSLFLLLFVNKRMETIHLNSEPSWEVMPPEIAITKIASIIPSANIVGWNRVTFKTLIRPLSPPNGMGG